MIAFLVWATFGLCVVLWALSAAVSAACLQRYGDDWDQADAFIVSLVAGPIPAAYFGLLGLQTWVARRLP